MATEEKTMQTLIEQRHELTAVLARCDGGAFPGSKAFTRETAALLALADFDAAHPEVILAVRAGRTPSAEALAEVD